MAGPSAGALADRVEFLIVTGLSGAGKSQATHALEDLGFFCVDNLPPALIPKFAEIIQESQGRIRRVALVIDVRGGEFFNTLDAALAALSALGINYQILFLDASDEVLVRRFEETRRKHPLGGSVLDGIRSERKRLQPLKERAHKIIDTTGLSARELREELADTFLRTPGANALTSASRRSATSTGFRSTPTWSSTSGSCRIRTTSRRCARSQARAPRCGTGCCSGSRRGSSSGASTTSSPTCCRSTRRRGRRI